MGMEFGLFQQQSTSLMMTQKLQQAIHLLQLSALDLTTFINEEAIENPLLDVEERNLTEQMDMHSPIYMNSSYRRSEDEPSPIDYACTSRLSLSEYLLHQVQDLTLTTKVKEQLTYFIYSLRDDGYLSRPLHHLCDEFNISLKEGERTLEILQSLEPAGIGAKNLQECLFLQ